jgi:hypothetical protein
MCRPESPDPGEPRHGTLLKRAQDVATSTAMSALCLACTQTLASIAESLLTSPSEHVEVVPHGHHAEIGSPARRCRIELLPLLLLSREPKELIRLFCTVQHAHTRVSLKSHDDLSSPGPPLHHLTQDIRPPRCPSSPMFDCAGMFPPNT